jgi:hypothetical protein
MNVGQKEHLFIHLFVSLFIYLLILIYVSRSNIYAAPCGVSSV